MSKGDSRAIECLLTSMNSISACIGLTVLGRYRIGLSASWGNSRAIARAIQGDRPSMQVTALRAFRAIDFVIMVSPQAKTGPSPAVMSIGLNRPNYCPHGSYVVGVAPMRMGRRGKG